MEVNEPEKPDESFARHGGARKGAGRPKKVPMESGKITRLRLFEDTASKWKTLQLAANFPTHEEFASFLLDKYEADINQSDDAAHQLQVTSSLLLDNLSKLEAQSNIGSKKRKPQRTLHIDPHGSASLVKNMKDGHPVPKQLLQCSQRVKESIANLDKELKCFSEDLSSQNKKPASLSHYNILGENGMLSIRTCKSTEDRLPPIDGTSGVHTVDVFCPKTPQRLYFTPVDNSVVVDSDDSTSSSSSSSDGFLPDPSNASTTTSTTRSRNRNKPVTVVSVPDPDPDQDSTDHKGVTVVIIPDLSGQSESLQNIENQKVTLQTDTLLNESSNTNSSCSPLTSKESNQQKPLKDFSLKVVKLPQSMLGGSNLSTSLQNSPTEAKIADDEETKGNSVLLSFQINHTEAASTHHSAKLQEDADSGTEIDFVVQAKPVFSTEDVEIDPLCNEDVQDSASVTTNDDRNASPNNSDCNSALLIHVSSAEDHCKPPSTTSHKEGSKELKDSSSGNNSKSTSSVSQSQSKKTRRKKFKSQNFVTSSCSEQEDTLTVSQSQSKKYRRKEFKSQNFVTSSCSEQEDTLTNAEIHSSQQDNNISTVSHQKAVSTKLADCGEENGAISSKKLESKTQESGTLELSPSPKSLPADDDLNHSSPLFKRKLFSSDKENSNKQSTNVSKKSSSKPKLRSKGKPRSDNIPCLSCNKTINLSSRTFYKHPRFSAYMCKKCHQLYTKGSFTVDDVDGHEEYCCICGEGGDIVCCDFCSYSVCQDCIQRIAGKEYMAKTLENEEDWKCFSCDTTLLHIYEQHYSLHDAGDRLVDVPESHEEKLEIDNGADDKECDSPVLQSLSSCNVSGIDTDEVSMSDTELCNNINENNSEENGSSSSRSSNAANSKLPPTASRKKKRGLVDRLLDSDNSENDEVSKRAKYSLSETDDDVAIVEPVSKDPENLSDSLHYTLVQTSSDSDKHSDSDSDPVDMKARSSGKVHLSSDDSQQLSPDCSSNQKLKQYSTRSKGYKGSELENASKAKRKNRKRNVVLSSDSDSDTSVKDTMPLTPGKKRRKLRKLIDDNMLAMQTKKAQKDEQLRLQRIKEKNKMNARSEDDHFILEKSEDVTIDVNPAIACHLKPHQREGVKFLWNCCCENLKQLTTTPGSGAILAHCMGLGKTLQVIAFIEALLRNESITKIFRIAIIVPVNTLENWKNELEKWIPEDDRPRIYLPAFCNSLPTRLNELEDWFEIGGILVCGYEMYRNLASGKGKGFKSKKSRTKAVSKYLLDPGPDMVVCDEGHVLKNPKSLLSQELTKLRTLRRIVLTGTPLQNNLMEYYTMVSFVKPSLLGTQKEFSNRFVNPIKNGQCRDSDVHDVRLMKYRSHVLHKLLEGCVQRHDYSVLTKDLPAKQEYVILLRLSDVQESLYKLYLDRHVDHANLGIGGTLLVAYQMLFKIWNHPWVLRLRDLQKREEEEIEEDTNSLRNFIVSGSENDDDTRQSPKNRDDPDLIILSDNEPVEKPGTVIANQFVGDAGREWYGDIFTDDMETMLELSGKLVFLFQLLDETQRLDEKVLVFSQSLSTLDLIESFLQMQEYGDWCRGLDYLRIDGSTSANCRSYCVDTFNSEENPKTRLFLISTRAGSLGVNLTAANRVVIFDASWNPTNDLQAIFRTYRYGQTKPVFIYRLLSKGTMEEKIYERQVTKESLSLRVVDEKQISRHYSLAELSELFEYSPAEKRETPDPSLSDPKEDLVLCNLLKSLHPKWIAGYHERDSLLEHRFAEELTEEERKKAWENYEAKKTESVQYAQSAVLISQLQAQQQNAFAGAGPSVLFNNGQPPVMPYTNQPHPPGSIVQGIQEVVMLAIQNCQALDGLKNEINRINFDLARPGLRSMNHTQTLLQLKAQKVDRLRRACESLKPPLRVISTALHSSAVPAQYKTKLDPIFRHITETLQMLQNCNL